MTLSQNYCDANLSEALTLLLDRLGERPIYMDEVVNDDLTVAHIYRTTWQELTDRELVTARNALGAAATSSPARGGGRHSSFKVVVILSSPFSSPLVRRA